MLKKQDRQGVRTPADLERKYNLGLLGGGTGDSKLGTQLQQVSQSLAQYIATTNALIAELQAQSESQSIILTASGTNIALTDSANSFLVSLKINGSSGGATFGKVWTSNADGNEKTEAVLSASVTLNVGDVLLDGQITRSNGTVEQLPEADKAALRNLKTFKTTTQFYTDGTVQPSMEIEYVADTKTYIDNCVRG